MGHGSAPQGGSLMVAVQPGQQAAHSVSGAGGGNFGAFHLPMVSVRSATDIDMMKWKMSFQNVISFHKLQSIVEEGKPPERDAVIKNWPELQGDAIAAKFNECLSDYQRENILLWSPNFHGLPTHWEWRRRQWQWRRWACFSHDDGVNGQRVDCKCGGHALTLEHAFEPFGNASLSHPGVERRDCCGYSRAVRLGHQPQRSSTTVRLARATSSLSGSQGSSPL